MNPPPWRFVGGSAERADSSGNVERMHEASRTEGGQALAGVPDQLEELRPDEQLVRRRRVAARLQGQGLWLVFAVLVVVMWRMSPYFVNASNIPTAASVAAILGVMAVTETVLVITGEIDISVGSVMAVTSVVIGLLVHDGVDVWAAAGVGLLLSAVVGTINGVVTVWFKVNSLVTTLGTYSIFLGVAYVLSNTATVSIGGQGFGDIGSGSVGVVPVTVILFLVVWLIGYGVTRGTALGRHIYAVGDNIEAANRAGINSSLVRLGAFIACAVTAGLAGIIVTSELSAAAPQIGDPYLLSVITAVILGGASLRGGRGTLLGTFAAVAILGVLQNGFALLQFSSYLEDVVLGTLLIAAVLSDQLVRRSER